MTQLKKNTSLPKIPGQLHPVFKQAPGTAGPTSGRLGSSTANTYEYASNMGGYPVDSQLQYGVMSQQTRAAEEMSNHPNESIIGNKIQSQLSQNEPPTLG